MLAEAGVVAAITLVLGALAPALTTGEAVFGAVVIFLAAGWATRLWLLRPFPRGMQLLQQDRAAEAIEQFQATYDFFSRHPRLDSLRAILFLNPSQFGYREVALCNIGYCYIKLGKGQMALTFYERVVREFPNSPLGKNAIQFAKAFGVPTNSGAA